MVGLASPPEPMAGTMEEPSLDEVLAGFDDGAGDDEGLSTAAEADVEDTGDDADLDDVLSGFDEPALVDAVADTSSDDSTEAPLDEVLSGFDEPEDGAASGAEPADDDEESPPESDSGVFAIGRFSGSLSFSGVYAFVDRDQRAPGSTDFKGVTRLRTRMDLKYEADLLPGWRLNAEGHAWYDWVYNLVDRDYPDKVVDDYKREVEVDDLWLRGRLSSFADIKLGRQVVVWGKSDNLRVTDVLNPLDGRELGMVDIEDLRLPVTMSRLDLYQGDWNLTGLLIHEVRMDKLPAFGSEFYPFPGPLPSNDVPSGTVAHTQLGLALNGTFRAWDLSLYAANLYDRTPYIANPGTAQAERRHARITMFGAAADLPLGNWLWKAELAHFPNLRLTGITDRVARSDVLLGVEYSGFDDTSLSLDLVDRHYYQYDPLPGGPPRNDWQAAVRYQGDFQHDRLHLTLVGTFIELFDNKAGFVRASGEYELTDAIDLTLGVVFYQEGDRPPASGVGDNDRVFLDLEWSF
jgi:hypothetical protein